VNDHRPDAEREFLITGARTYLDADDAMKEFRRLIQEQSRTVVCDRLAEINRVCGANWSTDDLGLYSERPAGYDCCQFGQQLPVEELGGLYFCLKLSREGENKLCHAVAFLYRRNKSLAASLWGCFKEGAFATASVGPWNLFFARHVSEENIPEFREYLNQAITDFIAFIENSGGLRKHLGQGA